MNKAIIDDGLVKTESISSLRELKHLAELPNDSESAENRRNIKNNKTRMRVNRRKKCVNYEHLQMLQAI